MKTTSAAVFFLFGLALFGVGLEITAKPAFGQEQASDAAFWDSVYQDNHVLEIEIKLTQVGWDKMHPEPQRRGPGQRGIDGTKYTYVKSEITIDGESFVDAGLRFKGNSSYRFSSRTMKRPLKIDIDRFDAKQNLHGRTKLNLSNSFLDSAFMKEKLAYEVYQSAGLATPGVGWANVTLNIDGNKTPLGVYVVVEQVDKRFIETHFGKATRGSLLMKPESVNDWTYLGENPKEYARYGIKTGAENTEQIKRFAELLKMIDEAPLAELEKEIGDRVDLPQLAGYLAATSVLANIDSYIGMPHNYYLMMDKVDGKLRIMPWDVNEAFGTFTMGSSPESLADWDIDRPWVASRALLQVLFKTESFPKLYRAAVADLMKDFTEEKLFARIDEFEKAIEPYVGNYEKGRGVEGLKMGIVGDSEGINRAVPRRVYAIKPFITRRIKSIQSQLSGEKGQSISPRRRR